MIPNLNIQSLIMYFALCNLRHGHREPGRPVESARVLWNHIAMDATNLSGHQSLVS